MKRKRKEGIGKLLLASILFMVLIELVACVAVLYVVLTTGAK